MTIICALRDDALGEVWIGADSRVSAKGHSFIWPESARKIVACGRWRLGIAGYAVSWRIVRDLAAGIAAAENPEAISDLLYAELKRRDFKRSEGSPTGPPYYGQAFIVADRSRVWEIADGGSVAEPDFGFAAIGSGDELAYGAWHALNGMGLSPGQVVLAALQAACAFSSDCGGELMVERVQ